LGDPLLIALATAFGYLITNLVESSYIAYFGISPNYSLIQPSIAETILTTLTVCFLSLFCILLSKPIYKLIAPKEETKENFWRHIFSIFLGFLIPFIGIKILLAGGITWTMVLEFTVFIVGAALGIVIGYYGSKDFLEKNRVFDNLFFDSYILNYFKNNLSMIGIWWSLFLGILISLLLAPSVGSAIAKNSMTYNVINSNPPLAVVAQYGDIIIAEPFDPNTKRFINQAHLININSLEQQNLYVSAEAIGPLHP
jgi:hypothetical protein